ncbi:MAG TPA: hypothetical protein VHA76_16680 [Solirubrobacterales bacterium]|nr:hypothetical protein [Solirubrobacterales bacterium]
MLDREAVRQPTNRLPLVAQRATNDYGLDRARARAELRRQIGRLERELGALVAAGLGRVSVPHRVEAAGPPRVLGLGELEEVRDALAGRIADARRALAERDAFEAANRALLEDLLAAPEEHRWVRVSRADVGLPGCGAWHSRPVLGPLGMLMGWWRVKVSSGCPRGGRLAAASRNRRRGPRRPGARRRWPSWRSSPGSSAWRSGSSAPTTP